MDEKSTELGEIKYENRKFQKEEWRDSAATLSDLYSSTCLSWEVLPGVYKIQSAELYISGNEVHKPPTRQDDSTQGKLFGSACMYLFTLPLLEVTLW